MVTAEVAVLLPALVALVVLGLRAVAVARTALGCADGARAAARAAARDEPPRHVVAVAREQCDASASVTVQPVGGLVRVRVVTQAALAPGLAVPVSAVAVARREAQP